MMWRLSYRRGGVFNQPFGARARHLEGVQYGVFRVCGDSVY